MKLEKIITLASAPVRLRLLAMVRSLRAVGCELPVWVVPYSDRREDRFELPPGCQWWDHPEIDAWLAAGGATPLMRRCACLLEGGYQFADTDIVFLRNPADALADLEGFITSCGHWHNPGHTMTPESEPRFRRASTVWQQTVFNSGQFACDRPLFADFQALRRVAEAPENAGTFFGWQTDQPGLNLMRLVSGAPIRNVTLPPVSMESTWAGDYHDAKYESYWQDTARRPYLIHWAGVPMQVERPINELFYHYLTPAERDEWHAQIRSKTVSGQKLRPRLHRAKRRAMRVWDAIVDG